MSKKKKRWVSKSEKLHQRKSKKGETNKEIKAPFMNNIKENEEMVLHEQYLCFAEEL